MKRLVSVVALTVTCLAYSASAVPSGDGLYLRPYIGADYQYNHVVDSGAGDSYQTDLNGGAAHFGVRLNENFGVELGYEATEEGTKDNVAGANVSTKLQEQGATLDLLGYLPYNGISREFEWIGTVGIAEVYRSAKVSTGLKEEDTLTKGRIGLGGQYWISNHFNYRILARYEGEDFNSDNADNSILLSAGLSYQF